MDRKRIVIVGAGGFAREVRWLIDDLNREGGAWEFVGYVVSDLAAVGAHDSRDEILGDVGWLHTHRDRFDALAIGIGTPAARLKVGRELLDDFPERYWPPLVHPSVRYDARTTTFDPGVIVCAGVIATVNVRLRSFSMVNLSCTIGHEAEVGEGCVLNPTVNVSGGVILDEGVLVGTGAQLLQYLRVGKGSTIGAGSVVTRNVPEGVTVVGIPATLLMKKKP